MKINELIQSAGRPFPSLEVVPPLTGMNSEDILRTIGDLVEFAPRYVNVTCHRDEYGFSQNSDGSWSRILTKSRRSPIEICREISAKFGVETVPHLICAGNSADDIRALVKEVTDAGIGNVMALRGDSLESERRFTPVPGGYSHADELVKAIREQTGDTLCIGVGGYPEKHFEAANLDDDISALKQKVEAGADFIITQMFFDNAKFYDFSERCLEAGITVPIIPGIKPLSTVRHISLLPEAFSIDIPLPLTEAVREAEKDRFDPKEAVYRVGTDWAAAQVRDLLAHGVKAVHFYTMGRSRNIREILRRTF